MCHDDLFQIFEPYIRYTAEFVFYWYDIAFLSDLWRPFILKIGNHVAAQSFTLVPIISFIIVFLDCDLKAIADWQDTMLYTGYVSVLDRSYNFNMFRESLCISIRPFLQFYHVQREFFIFRLIFLSMSHTIVHERATY